MPNVRERINRPRPHVRCPSCRWQGRHIYDVDEGNYGRCPLCQTLVVKRGMTLEERSDAKAKRELASGGEL